MAKKLNKHMSMISYLLICFIISTPFNYANFQLLYTTDGVPAGADVTHHTYFILKILETNNPLISYTAYPTILENLTSYYPSLMHLTISSVAKIISYIDGDISDPAFVIEVEKLFMLAVSLIGTAGYAIFIRTILDKLINHKINMHLQTFHDTRYRITFLVISVLAFGVFIYSVSPIINTYNDGTYGEITAMWGIFPYYLYFLVTKHWKISGLLLALIASTHNLAFLMALSATIPYFISLLLQRTKRLKIILIKFVVTFLVFGTPAIIFFYLPITAAVLQGGAGEPIYRSWSTDSVAQQLKPGLFYAGIIAVTLAVILNYRILGWISSWALIYFIVFDLSEVLGERFGRELSVVFGLLVGICIAYVLFMTVLAGKRWFRQGTLGLNNTLISSGKIVLIITISAAVASTSYLYFQERMNAVSNPNLAKYFTETVGKSNEYFLALIDDDNTNNNGVIALFGLNPWLKVTTYGKFDVLAVLSPEGSKAAGRFERQISGELHQIVDSPNIKSTACIIKKYDIDYVYISDRIPGRFYSPYQSNTYYNQLSLFQSVADSPFYDLTKEFIGEEGEHIKIYSTIKNSVKQTCD